MTASLESSYFYTLFNLEALSSEYMEITKKIYPHYLSAEFGWLFRFKSLVLQFSTRVSSSTT